MVESRHEQGDTTIESGQLQPVHSSPVSLCVRASRHHGRRGLVGAARRLEASTLHYLCRLLSQHRRLAAFLAS
jgi:hypothetical protein